MKTYTLIANVDQIVTRKLRILVEATSEEEAQDKVRQALADFPDAINDTLGVKRILPIKQHFWIPKSIEFDTVKEERDIA